MDKKEKLTLAVFAFAAVVLFVSWRSGAQFDWNGLFNGTIQTLLGTLLAIPVTIWIYRYMYHRKGR